MSVGVLTKVFPGELVDDVVEFCGRTERRSRLMPARLTVYFVLALALFSSESYDGVIRRLVAGFEWTDQWDEVWRPPTKAALFKARVRLGPKVMQELFARVARQPLGEAAGPRGLRVVATGGMTLNVPDTPDNAAAFGSPPAGKGSTPAWPRARVVVLADCGTYAILAARLEESPDRDQSFEADLFQALDPSMLLVADRGCFSYRRWQQALATGAQVCWRIKRQTTLPNLNTFFDHSYRSRVYPGPDARNHDAGGLDVRVVADPASATVEPRRLITTLLDPKTASVEDLTHALDQQCRIKSALDEPNTNRTRRALVLRSKSPSSSAKKCGPTCVSTTPYAGSFLTPPPSLAGQLSKRSHDCQRALASFPVFRTTEYGAQHQSETTPTKRGAS
jgi:hypothetical protein